MKTIYGAPRDHIATISDFADLDGMDALAGTRHSLVIGEDGILSRFRRNMARIAQEEFPGFERFDTP